MDHILDSLIRAHRVFLILLCFGNYANNTSIFIQEQRLDLPSHKRMQQPGLCASLVGCSSAHQKVSDSIQVKTLAQVAGSTPGWECAGISQLIFLSLLDVSLSLKIS